MKTNVLIATASFAILAASTISDAHAANCDAIKSKFLWRSCMSKEVDKLSAAISAKALDFCYGKTNSEKGPAAVYERLTCRVDKLTKTLQGMN